MADEIFIPIPIFAGHSGGSCFLDEGTTARGNFLGIANLQRSALFKFDMDAKLV